MIDLTPEEEARLRRWLALQESDVDAAVERAAEAMFTSERLAHDIERLGDQISAAIIPDIEALLGGINERLAALEKIVMRTMPTVRRQQSGTDA